MKSNNKRKFRSMNSVLSGVLEKHNLAHVHLLNEITNNWESFDKTIAAHSEPLKYDFQTKTLYLKINNAMWKKEFSLNKETLLVKIKNAFNNINIKKIEII